MVEEKEGFGYYLLLILVALIVFGAIWIMLSSIFNYYACENLYQNLNESEYLSLSFQGGTLSSCIAGFASPKGYSNNEVFSPVLYRELGYVSIALTFGEWFILTALFNSIFTRLIYEYNKKRGGSPPTQAEPAATASS